MQPFVGERGILARGTPVCQLWLNGLPYGARGRGVSWQIAGLGNGCGMFSRLRWRKLGKRCQIRNSSSKHPKVQSARLIAEAGAHSNWPQALHLWKTCKDIPGSADATIKALGRGVQWERAAEFLSNQMASSAGHGVTLLAVAEATAWRHCLSILSTMQLRRVDATPTSLNATIVSCGRRFMWQSALNLLFAYEQQASHQPIVTADCAMAVLTALQVAHQWEQAIAMISTLPDPNESHMTAVVEACKRSHAWEASLRFLGTTIDQNACDAAMRACAISSEWQATLSLLSRHTEPEPSGVSTALSALAKAMQWQRAIHLFNQTQMLWTLKPENRKVRKGKEDGESWEIIKDRSLLRALGAGHLWEDALFHFQSANAQDAWNLSAAIWACQVAEQSVARELLSEHLRQHQRRRSKRKELRVLEHLSQLSDPDAVQILASIEDFSKENRWLKVAGGEKGQILESVIRPGERVLEVGSYIGFTALRLAQHGCEVVTIEADPLNAAVAQEIVEMASMASMDTMGGGSPMTSRVKICVGRATDWLSSGLLDPVDVILLDHRGTIYHEDLELAEPLLRPGGRVIADNVLHPGAPLFVYDVRDRYNLQVHVLEEFGMPNIEDWLFVCHPKTWPLPHRMQLASSGSAAVRQWGAEVNRLCHESKFGPVDWEEFQGRLRPMLLEMLGDAVEYHKIHKPGAAGEN